MIRECAPNDIGISVSYPLPGTRFFEAVRTQLGLQRHWVDSSDLAMLYQGPFTTAFYRKLHALTHHEFRARRAWRELRRRWRRANRRPLVLHGEGAKPTAALLRSLILNLALLAPTRMQLELLSRRPHQALGPIGPDLQPEEAASPSPQDVEAESLVQQR
jgi:hypothetical protein